MKGRVVSGIVMGSIFCGAAMGNVLEDRVAELEKQIQSLEMKLEKTQEDISALKAAQTRASSAPKANDRLEKQSDFLKYTENHNGITLTGYIRGKLNGDVVFPSEINGKAVTEISGKAFYYIPDLTSVTIPASITTIGMFNFSACTNLTAIHVDENNPAFCSVDGILFSKDMATLVQAPFMLEGDYVIPDGVTELGRSAFQRCNISTLSIPASVTKYDTYTFGSMPNLTSFIVAEDSPVFAAIDGVLFNKEKTLLIKCPDVCGAEYTVPDGVEVLANGAFERNNDIIKVILPEGLKTIERDVFLHCKNLKLVELPESLEAIEPLSFSNSGITNIHLPKNLEKLGSIAFRYCNDLEQITVADDNPNFCAKDKVVYSKDMTRLVTCLNSKQGVFEVPGSVKVLGSWPFDSCNSLVEIHLPVTLEKMENGAFIRAGGITSIVIPPKIDNLEYYSFLGAQKLEWILFLGDAPKVGHNAFMHVPNNLKIYYREDANGFTSPIWHGIETEACSEEKVEKLIAESRTHLQASN